MLVVSAFQFMAKSILTQYIRMVFEQSNRGPLYVLKQARLTQRSAVVGRSQRPPRLVGFAQIEAAHCAAIPFASDQTEKSIGTEVR
jgi:hypothetical protein